MQGWLANDFTLAEIKQLDAGSWFDPKFKGERIPTFDEAVALIRGKAGMFPELKTPEVYTGRDVDFETSRRRSARQARLRGPKADPKTPIILQTFSESSAKRLAAMKIGVPVVLAVVERQGLGVGRESQGVEAVRAGPRPRQGHRRSQSGSREVGARRGHDGHAVHVPFLGDRKVPDVKAEMEHFLYTLGVDALFTDNPDQFPRR